MAEETMRMTKQRRVILETVRAAHGHPTADEVYLRVRSRLPRISLATVYRNLEQLSEAGAMRRIEPGRGRMRFECRPEPHAHLRCTDCGCIRDAPAGVAPDWDDLPRSCNGFRITGCCLQLLGLCPACRRKRHRPSASGHTATRRKGSP